MKRIVSDTGPLLHLREADALPALTAMAEVRIPPAVRGELGRLEPEWKLEEAVWVQVEALWEPFAKEALSWQRAGLLHPGEAEAVVLARQSNADWLLTDDAAARLVAEGQGFEVHGSLGVVLGAAATGNLDREAAYQAVDGLARSSLWISSAVLGEAKEALRMIFSEQE